MSAPDQPPLVVDVTHLARRLGLPVPIEDEDVAFLLEEAIRDKMAVVESYLGVVITPAQYVESGRWPNPSGWLLQHEPLVTVLSAVPETEDGVPVGTYTVTYTAGIDAAAGGMYEPIRRWVIAHAQTTPEVRRLVRTADVPGTRYAKSVSAEGQSISYGDDLSGGPGGGGTALSNSMLDGRSLPTLASLDRWRRANRRVYQGPSR